MSRCTEIPFTIVETAGIARRRVPVTRGVPLPQGLVADVDMLSLRDQGGAPLPLQPRALAVWPDGSAKWVLVDTQVDLDAGGQKELRLTTGKPSAFSGPAIKRTDSDEALTVGTGALEVRLRKDRFNFIDQAWLTADGKRTRIVKPGARGLVVTDSRNVEYWSSRDRDDYTLQIEEAGPLRTSVRCRGWHVAEDGRRLCMFIVRFHFYAGLPIVKAMHTFVYAGDPAIDFIKGIELETVVDLPGHFGIASPKGRRTYAFGGDGKPVAGEVRIRDIDCAPFPHESPHHVLQHEPDRFYIHNFGQPFVMGKQAEGWLSYGDQEAGVVISVPQFWQQSPKELKAQAQTDALTVGVWPLCGPDLLNVCRGRDDTVYYEGAGRDGVGMAKTHEVWYAFHTGQLAPEDAREYALTLQQPPFVRLSAEWVAESQALGRLHPKDDARFGPQEEWVEETMSWLENHIERNGWYGMMDFGDVQREWDVDNERWTRVRGTGWLNSEMDLHHGLFVQFLRSGNRRAYDLAVAMARHVMDVDTVHPTEFDFCYDPAVLGNVSIGGTCRHCMKHWDSVPNPCHTNVDGFLDYYYLTGDERALEVCRECGEHFLAAPWNMAGGTRNMGAQLRGAMLLYSAFGDERYLQFAHDMAATLVAGQYDSGVWGTLYDVRTGKWSELAVYHAHYILAGLALYHDVEPDESVKACFLRSCDYFCENEDLDDLRHGQALSFFCTNGQIFKSYADAYRMSGDEKYLRAGRRILDGFLEIQDLSDDWRFRGGIKGHLQTAVSGPALQAMPYLLAELAVAAMRMEA